MSTLNNTISTKRDLSSELTSDENEIESNWTTICLHKGKEIFICQHYIKILQENFIQKVILKQTKEQNIKIILVKAESPVITLKDYIIEKTKEGITFIEEDLWMLIKRMINILSIFESNLIPVKDITIDSFVINEINNSICYTLKYDIIDWNVLDNHVDSLYALLRCLRHLNFSDLSLTDMITNNDTLKNIFAGEYLTDIFVLKKYIENRSKHILKTLFGTVARIAICDIKHNQQHKELISRTSLKEALFETGYSYEFINFMLYILFIRDMSSLPTISKLSDYFYNKHHLEDIYTNKISSSRSGLSFNDFINGVSTLRLIEFDHSLRFYNRLKDYYSDQISRYKHYYKHTDTRTGSDKQSYFIPKHRNGEISSEHRLYLSNNQHEQPIKEDNKTHANNIISAKIRDEEIEDQNSFKLVEENSSTNDIQNLFLKFDSLQFNTNVIKANATDEKIRSNYEDSFNFKSYIDENKTMTFGCQNIDKNNGKLSSFGKQYLKGVNNLASFLRKGNFKMEKDDFSNENTNTLLHIQEDDIIINSFEAEKKSALKNSMSDNNNTNFQCDDIDTKLCKYNSIEQNDTGALDKKEACDNKHKARELQTTSKIYAQQRFCSDYFNGVGKMNDLETPRKTKDKTSYLLHNDYKYNHLSSNIKPEAYDENYYRLYKEGSDEKFVNLSHKNNSTSKNKEVIPNLSEGTEMEFRSDHIQNKLEDSDFYIKKQLNQNIQERIASKVNEEMINIKINNMWGNNCYGDNRYESDIYKDSFQNENRANTTSNSQNYSHNNFGEYKLDSQDIEISEYKKDEENLSKNMSEINLNNSYSKDQYYENYHLNKNNSSNSRISYDKERELDLSANTMGDNPVFPNAERLDTPKNEALKINEQII